MVKARRDRNAKVEGAAPTCRTVAAGRIDDARTDPGAMTSSETANLKFPTLADEQVGQMLGRDKLRKKLREGGFGTVGEAVALKIIKLGMDTKHIVARFEPERQAMAMMEHPKMAKVLDARTTDVGHPCFVMELVRGVRITGLPRPGQWHHQETARWTWIGESVQTIGRAASARFRISRSSGR